MLKVLHNIKLKKCFAAELLRRARVTFKAKHSVDAVSKTNKVISFDCVRLHVRARERENSNSKTLFYKDCSLGSVKNLSNN